MINQLWQPGRDFLGVEYPIVAGGMTWISNFELVHAVSEAGAFPVLAGGNMPADLFEKEVDRCIEHLRHPFAVNLITIAPNFHQHYEILKAKKVPFVVFAGNFPRKHDIQGMKAAGKRTICFASADSIANQMVRFGIDGLILEGSEAGGHIGHVSLTILLQQVLFKLRGFPVFVAGGIGTGTMIAHLLMMGAWGAQLGTRFVMTDECTAHPNFKEAFLRARARQAIATPQYDSKLPVVAVRALANKSLEAFGRLQMKLLLEMQAGEISREQAQFQVENFWVGGLRKAVVDGDVENGSVMAGQSVGLMHDIKPMKQCVLDLVSEADEELLRTRAVLEGLGA
jgi:enoyl-[acyl-carrier protein] reductase II